MKTYGKVEVYFHLFLISELDRSHQFHSPTAFSSRKESSVHVVEEICFRNRKIFKKNSDNVSDLMDIKYSRPKMDSIPGRLG